MSEAKMEAELAAENERSCTDARIRICRPIGETLVLVASKNIETFRFALGVVLGRYGIDRSTEPGVQPDQGEGV